MIPDRDEEDILNLLLVDDDEDSLSLTSEILEQESGVQTETETSPKKALATLNDKNYDGIISDLKMPEMDGLELLSEVKQIEDIPFILFTANSGEDEAIEALNNGADGYFRKNLDVDEYQVVLDRMRSEVEKRETMRRGRDFVEIIDNLDAGIYKIDGDMNFEFMNRTLREALGLETVQGLNIEDFPDMGIIPNEELDEVIEDYEQALEDPSENWHDVKLPNGDEATIYSNIVPLQDGGYAGVVYDVTKLKQEKEKSELLSSILTHDLNNKLATIGGYMRLINSDELSDEEREYYNKSISSLDEAVEITEKVSRVKSLEQEKEQRKIRVDQSMSSAIEDLETDAEEKGIQINYELEDGVVVYGDDIIENMFYNIIENSIEHSGASQIDVDITRESDEVEVYIGDDGEGMDISIEDGSFEEYRSLGTYLISEIARLNDFEMDVNTGDQGTEYTLRTEIAEE